MGEISIREATPADADALTALFLAARREAMPYLPELHTDDETRAWMSGVVLVKHEVYVAEREGSVAGFMALSADMVEHLYVHPDHQGRGVGGLLLERAKGVRPGGLSLWVFQRNEIARRFYEARGFRLVELTHGERNEEREPDARYEWP